MFRIIIIIVLIISPFSLVFAEDNFDFNNLNDIPAAAEEDKGLSHREVFLAPLISTILTGLYITEDAVFNVTDMGNTEIWIKRGTLFSIHVPLYSVSLFEGMLSTGISLGCFGMYEYLEDKDVDFFRNFFYTGIFQTGLYSTYLAYSRNREKAKPGIYNDEWRQETFAAKFSEELGNLGDVYEKWRSYTLLDLAVSPFKPDNLFDPMVGIFPIAGIISPLIRNSHDSAPWTTGEMYVGTWEMNPAAAVPLMLAFFFVESSIISISEESQFRGFIYEEIGSNYGHIPAKVVDCIYFPAIHVPQEVFILENDPLTILWNSLSRVMLTFYMDNLYDRGGLERTVAAHFWIDFTLLFVQWLMASGEPQPDVSSIMALLPEFRIQIPLIY